MFLFFGFCFVSLIVDFMGKEGCKNRVLNVDFVIFIVEEEFRKIFFIFCLYFYIYSFVSVKFYI